MKAAPRTCPLLGTLPASSSSAAGSVDAAAAEEAASEEEAAARAAVVEAAAEGMVVVWCMEVAVREGVRAVVAKVVAMAMEAVERAAALEREV